MEHGWKDWPDRVPNLERGELETIIALMDTVPEDEGIRRLRKKIEASMSVYHWEDDLIKKARAGFEARRNDRPAG